MEGICDRPIEVQQTPCSPSSDVRVESDALVDDNTCPSGMECLSQSPETLGYGPERFTSIAVDAIDNPPKDLQHNLPAKGTEQSIYDSV
jgi:hypothetical protein